MLFALIIYVVLALMAFFVGGVRLEIGQWVLLGAIAVLGVIPFCAIGLMIGSKANASASPAFVNLIYLPMAFLSGLWMPLTMLPSFFTQIAPLWPAYHLAQLAQMTIGMEPWADVPIHLLWLLGFSAVCFAIARRWLTKSA
jgi:ABC-2 type transport system permease protein